MIKEIYIDMDGVLCAFKKRYDELYNEEAREDYSLSNNKKKDAYQRRFVEFVQGRNFATLMMLPDAALGLKFVSELGLPLRILSSTATPDLWGEIAGQKLDWLRFYKIDIAPIFVPGKAHKKLYAGEGKVLIDDTYSVIESWKGNGGIGIHHTSWIKTISEIKTMI